MGQQTAVPQLVDEQQLPAAAQRLVDGQQLPAAAQRPEPEQQRGAASGMAALRMVVGQQQELPVVEL